ncbi:hypothetical protein [Streptomyces sp. NPDC093589]|uniref:hypothetical protein n=1 Tax=Streptomyces sp. NPDC093589 TaxID=3366043 RepID=UPI0038015F45
MNPVVRGKAAIDWYRNEYGAPADLEVSVADLIADLRVLAVANDFDWDDVLAFAEGNATSELTCSVCGRTAPAALNDDLVCTDCITDHAVSNALPSPPESPTDTEGTSL